jgi:N-acyl-phosphatidylethanolamine-hydrolysing phospholipase D
VNKFKNLDGCRALGLLDIFRWHFGLLPEEPGYVSGDSLANSYRTAPLEEITLTWIGHSTFLIQHRGRSILTDPIFGNCGPLPLPWLRRAVPAGVPLEALPLIDDVLISHSHYDHLDAPTIQRLGIGSNYWTPSGLSKWLKRRGIKRCRELAWWETTKLSDDLELHCVPAQHFSGRSPFDRNQTHWCGWVLRSPSRTIYFTGDTGFCSVFREIGSRFGGFDVAMIPIGAYRPRWILKSVHIDPLEAVQIHLDVQSRQSVACHWGTFGLADEPLNEPPLVLETALSKQGVPEEQFRVLRFGESIVV